MFLSDEDAARADEVLAAAAPGLRVDQLGRKAAALEMKLDPEAVRIRKEHARSTRQRVEVRRELSGNASIAGRELDTARALACKAYIDAVAVKVRNHGGLEDSLSSVRALVMTELLQGRDPLNLLRPRPAAGRPRPAEADPPRARPPGRPRRPRPRRGPDDADYPCSPGDPDDPGPDDRDSPAEHDGPPALATPGRAGGPAGTPTTPRTPATASPTPTISRGAAPSDPARPPPSPPPSTSSSPSAPSSAGPPPPRTANGIGLLDPAETRDIIQAASRHPRTRWCATIINPDGTAAAHACAPGQHPWTPPPQTGPAGPGDSPNAGQLAHLHELLAQLKLTPEPIARGQCDHRHAEDHYTPSRKLKHLLRARTETCDAPGCNAQAVYCDQDHTTPWPDGPTDQCNLGPKCRRHHRCKQAPGWRVEQPEPGVIRWTLPSGRVYTTTPTVYDV